MADQPDPPLERHRVAVTVFVEADGIDRADAGHVATAAVRMSLLRQADGKRGPDGLHDLNLSFTDRHGRTFTVPMYGVMETGTAAGNGYLWVEPTARAYPRDDEHEESQ